MKRSRRQILLAYEKQRQRNRLAQPGVHDFVLVLDRLKPGFNVAKIFRSAQAFGARAVHLVEIGPFDPGPAKGALRKVPAHFYDDFSTCHARLAGEGFGFFLLEPAGAATLGQIDLPSKSAFVLGHEEFGFSFKRKDFSDLQSLAIPQVSSLQSLNVSVAASVVMYEYVRQRGFEVRIANRETR